MEYVLFKNRKFPIVYRIKETDPIFCPYCDRNHYHGIEDGHRVANCATDVPKRTLVFDDEEVDFNRGYFIKIGEPRDTRFLFENS